MNPITLLPGDTTAIPPTSNYADPACLDRPPVLPYSSVDASFLTHNVPVEWAAEVVWSSELSIFVIMDTFGSVSVSSDGINWTRYATPWFREYPRWDTLLDARIGKLLWVPELHMFICRGTRLNRRIDNFDPTVTQTIITSTDGIHWQKGYQSPGTLWWSFDSRASGPNLSLINDMDYSPSQGFLCHSSGIGEWGTNQFIQSIDGIHWGGILLDGLLAAGAHRGSNNYIQRIESLGLWLATAEPEITDTSENWCTIVYTSPDGLEWTATGTRLAADLNGTSTFFVWAPELGICVGNYLGQTSGRNSSIVTSTDLTLGSWVLRETPWDITVVHPPGWRDLPYVNSLVWSPQLGIFVAFGDGAGGIMTSPDGINWTAQSCPMSNGDSLHGKVVWSPELGLFAAVGATHSYIENTLTPTDPTNRIVMTSPDGINWTTHTIVDDPGSILHPTSYYCPSPGTDFSPPTVSQAVTNNSGIWTSDPVTTSQFRHP